MKTKTLLVLRTFTLLVIAGTLFTMATTVYGHLGVSVPFFTTDTQPHSLPEPLPALTEPEEIILENSAALKTVRQKSTEINSLSSLLIRKKGRLIVEEYFKNMEADRAVNIKSASKSIISLLVGIALERGILESLDQPISAFFPEYLNEGSDPEKLSITIEDLLTMRAGLKTTSFHNYAQWVSSRNWVQYVLDQPMVEEPGGEKMIYSTGSSHLLSVILTKASGMSTRDFARQHLFDPLDIKLKNWFRDPQGYYMGGNNMFMKPSDMAKIGRMVLNGGTYKDRRIVSEEWLLDSFRTYTQSNNNSNYYGYMWWKQKVAGYQALFACGYGGQYIFMFPELESVVVITSYLEYASESRQYHKPIFNLLKGAVIPYILEDGSRPERIMPTQEGSGAVIAR